MHDNISSDVNTYKIFKPSRRSNGIVIAIISAWIMSLIPESIDFLNHMSSIIYCGIIIYWMLSVEERIIESRIRHFLVV